MYIGSIGYYELSYTVLCKIQEMSWRIYFKSWYNAAPPTEPVIKEGTVGECPQYKRLAVVY